MIFYSHRRKCTILHTASRFVTLRGDLIDSCRDESATLAVQIVVQGRERFYSRDKNVDTRKNDRACVMNETRSLKAAYHETPRIFTLQLCNDSVLTIEIYSLALEFLALDVNNSSSMQLLHPLDNRLFAALLTLKGSATNISEEEKRLSNLDH